MTQVAQTLTFYADRNRHPMTGHRLGPSSFSPDNRPGIHPSAYHPRKWAPKDRAAPLRYRACRFAIRMVEYGCRSEYLFYR